MKRKELFVFSFICLLFAAFTFSMTFSVFSNQPLGDLLSTSIRQTEVVEVEDPTACTNSDKIENLSTSTEPHLKQIHLYQETCGSSFTSSAMVFAMMPFSAEAIEAETDRLAAILLEFESYGIKPIVVAEPSDENGLINFQAFSKKSHYPSLIQFFKALKAKGVTEKAMGVWVPFPEPNVPNWDSEGSTYANFGQNVNLYMQALQTEFPNTLGSVLLNATTYEPTDIEWNEGDYISLIPWVQNIEPKYIDSVGVQGFPWIARANQKPRRLFDAEEFLQPDFAIGMAREVRTKKIWFNTGTFSQKYSQNPDEAMNVLPSERKAILQDILKASARVQNLQTNGYEVSINIFAEDKTDKNEDTDWSYLSTPDEEFVFTEFVQKAQDQDVEVTIFDKAKPE